MVSQTNLFHCVRVDDIWGRREGSTCRNQGICDTREDRNMSMFINHVDAETISSLHQDIKIRSTGVDSHPPRVIVR